MEERAWEQKLKQAIMQKGLFSESMEGTVFLQLWGKKTPERHPEHENQVSALITPGEFSLKATEGTGLTG